MNQVLVTTHDKPDRRLTWLVSGAILLKLLLLPFAQTMDADAVSRTLISTDWLQHPVWITHGIWGPFHFYLTGFALFIWNNGIYAPVVLNILLSGLMLLPFYFLVKREFNRDGAFVAACFLAISPIIFRVSLMNMAETPYLLLLTLTLNLLSKGFKSHQPLHFLLAGFSITIASGIRFEPWFFISLFTIVILLRKEKLNAFLFLLTAMLYPATDMITNFISDHYSFTNFFSNYPWNMHPAGYFAPPQTIDFLRRIWFIPFCWLISIGPPFAFITIKELLFKSKKEKDFTWLAIVFWAFFTLTEVSAIRGSIILHNRFSATITLLGLPFIAPYFNNLQTSKVRQAWLFGALTIGLTFIYNMQNITPLPRLEDQNGASVAKLVARNVTMQSGLIIDFWEWQNPGYIELMSKLPPPNMFVINLDYDDKTKSDETTNFIQSHPKGVIILVKNSFLWQNTLISDGLLHFKFSSIILNIQEIYKDDKVAVYCYKIQDFIDYLAKPYKVYICLYPHNQAKHPSNCHIYAISPPERQFSTGI